MGWLWVLFLLFSVLANLLEKMGKGLVTPEAPERKRRNGWEEDGRPAEPLPAERTREVFPRPKPELAPVSAEKHTAGRAAHSRQSEDLLTAEEENLLLRPPLAPETEDSFRATWREENLLAGENSLTAGEEGEEEGEGSSFRSAFVLAQVLARPDFTTVPWRRRI